MCALRVILVTVMTTTVVIAMYRDAHGLSGDGGDFGTYSGAFESSPSVGSFFRPLGIFQLFPIVIFAQALHPSACRRRRFVCSYRREMCFVYVCVFCF